MRRIHRHVPLVLVVVLFAGFMWSCGGGSGSDSNPPADPTLLDLPHIEVSYPPRGATILGSPGDLSIQVTGTVSAGAGELSVFTINGEAVTVDAGGGFSHALSVKVGGNTLVMEAANDQGLDVRRVQAFTWSTEYNRYDDPGSMAGAADPGEGKWFGQAVIDDGDHSPPLDDLATQVEYVLSGLDLAGLIDPATPIGSASGFDIYLTSLTMSGSSISMTVINGGLTFTYVMTDLAGDLLFDCTTSSCQLLGGDSTGGIAISSIVFSGDLLLAVAPDGTLMATLQNAQTEVNGLDLSSDNAWTNFLLGVIEPFLINGLVADLENELNTQVVNLIPGVEDTLNLMAMGASAAGEILEYPSVHETGGSVEVTLVREASTITSSAADQGIKIGMSFGAYADSVIPYGNLGVPGRVGCGTGSQTIIIPGVSEVEAVVSDDAVNQQLYAQWRGGRFQFDVPASAVDLGAYSFTGVAITVSGMLAPTVSDCNADGELRVLVGDLKLDVSVTSEGVPIDAVAWAALESPVLAAADGSYLTFTTGSLLSLAVGLDVLQDEGVAIRGEIRDLVEDYIANSFFADLAAGPVVMQKLPQLDMRGVPGGSLLTMSPSTITRDSGNTIAGGTFQ